MGSLIRPQPLQAFLRANRRTFTSLRKYRNYRLFFSGQVVSVSGTWMQNIATAWLILSLTHSPVAVGVLALCQFLPFSVFGLFSGVLVDRFDARKTVIMTHVPPYDSGLDTAPLLSPDLRPTVSAGDVLRGPVGSTGVRKAIESFRPVLGVHGHIHESGGERRIADTVCVNAGSEANHGILRGYLVDLGDRGVERTLRVEG